MELVIFVGLQAAGKTTFYRERFAATHDIVSKDLFPNNRHRERRQRQLIGEALEAGRSVVVDNTNATAEDRAPLINLGRELGARIVGYYFESGVPDSMARNRHCVGKAMVPNVAIAATAKKLRPPSLDEGFDQLFAVRIAEAGAFEVRQISRDEPA